MNISKSRVYLHFLSFLFKSVHLVTFGKLLYTVVLKDSVVLKNPKSKGGKEGMGDSYNTFNSKNIFKK